MRSKDTFAGKSYEDKLTGLHEIVDPLKDKKPSFKKAYEIITRPNVSEEKLLKMYNYIFDTVENYKSKKKTEKAEEGEKKLQSMSQYLEELHKREEEEDKEGQALEEELMKKLSSI